MKAVGLLAGIGSLMREAQDCGLKVLGNVDVRGFFKSVDWIWEENFNAPGYYTLDALEEADPDWYEADIALGHPPCGSYSHLGKGGGKLEWFANDEERKAWHTARGQRKGLLPLFIKLVNKYQPKVFALDNLIGSLKAVTPDDWESALPGYHITFLQMINHDYGSPQHRARLWVIGTRHHKPFRFKPPKARLPGPTTLWEAIQDLPVEPWKNRPGVSHVHYPPSFDPFGTFWYRDVDGERKNNEHAANLAAGFLSLPMGNIWPYENNEGRFTAKPAQARIHHGRKARTGSGQETLRHPFTGWPLTIRERARILGWPDDFFLGGKDTDYNRTLMYLLVRATGRAVPSEFLRYLIPQLKKHARKIT